MKYKVSANATNASKLLFRQLITNLGGSTKVGNAVDLQRQAIHNFYVQGYVPLTQVYSIAKKLKLKVWHLSYYKLLEVHGDDAPQIPELLKELDVLSKEDKAKIMNAYKK